MLLALSLLSAQATAQHYDRIERVAPPAEVAAGLRFSISEGAAVEPVTELVPAAATVPLSAEALRALLARLPAFEADSQDRQTSALRDDSAPPPRSGASEAAPWPPTAVIEAPEPAAEAELRVLRHAPEGEVGLMPQLSITFSQPMVAVSSQAEAAAQVPALLEPQPAGAWRWLGSRTLVFEPTDGRFPMATRYQVSVPAGTRSAVGGALAQEHRFVFATPAPKLQFMFPQDVPQPLQPLLLMQFDQAVDLQAVLSQTRLIGPQRSLHPLQRVSLEEAQKLPEFEAQRAELVDGRWLALRPVEPLPKASAFRAEVSANLASLEGPRTTTGTQGWSFETYQPLAVAEWRCGWDSGKRRDCDPENPWMVELNNPLDAASFNASSIVVEPAVEDLQVDLNERHLQLRGLFASRTRYRILLPEALQDRFGQRLGPTAPLELQTGDAEPMLTGPDQMLVTLDPAAAPAVSVYSRGLESLEVEIHRVEPSQWGEYQTWLREAQSQDRPRPLPGRRLHSGKVWPGKAGGLTETLIALERYLDQGLGHLLLRVRPAQSDQRERWQQVVVWVQSTRLGLVAVHDDRQLTVWASELQTGRAAADVEIALTGGATAAGSTVARTSADGLARLPMLANCEAQLVLATFGADRAILPRSAYVWDPSTWQASPVADTLRWHVFDDRGMYRPGEQVRIKGWLRRLQADPHGDLQALAPSANPLRWKLADSRGVEIGNGQASLSALGGFDLAIDLPATPNLGHAHLSLEVEGVTDVASHSYEHRFQIQEFRRPEYEVSAAVEPGPHLIGGRALFEVSAAYYTGGGLSAAPVEWQLSATATRYAQRRRDPEHAQLECAHRCPGSTSAAGRVPQRRSAAAEPAVGAGDGDRSEPPGLVGEGRTAGASVGALRRTEVPPQLRAARRGGRGRGAGGRHRRRRAREGDATAHAVASGLETAGARMARGGRSGADVFAAARQRHVVQLPLDTEAAGRLSSRGDGAGRTGTRQWFGAADLGRRRRRPTRAERRAAERAAGAGSAASAARRHPAGVRAGAVRTRRGPAESGSRRRAGAAPVRTGRRQRHAQHPDRRIDGAGLRAAGGGGRAGAACGGRRHSGRHAPSGGLGQPADRGAAAGAHAESVGHAARHCVGAGRPDSHRAGRARRQ
jgi:hypothetical protein